MKTIDMVRSVRWIDQQLSETAKQLLFDTPLDTLAHVSREQAGEKRRELGTFLSSTHELAAARKTWLEHPHASLVLKGFGLGDLLEPNFASSLATAVVSPQDARTAGGPSLYRVRRAWRIMTGCVGPVESLTTPQAVSRETDFDDILTIEVAMKEDRGLSIDAISRVLRNVESLYQYCCRITASGEFQSLQLIFVASGTSVRLDFRGRGEPIRRLKELIVELWRLVRDSDADAAVRRLHVVREGIGLLELIEQKRQGKGLTDSEAATLREGVLNSGKELLKDGVRVREIPSTEVVHNVQLLEELQRKLLPAPPDLAPSPKKRNRKPRKSPRTRSRPGSSAATQEPELTESETTQEDDSGKLPES